MTEVKTYDENIAMLKAEDMAINAYYDHKSPSLRI